MEQARKVIRGWGIIAAALVMAMGTGSLVFAHFQALLPMTDECAGEEISLDILFTHPMAQAGTMEMKKPREFGVFAQGERHDLLGALKDKPVNGKSAFTASYTPKTPGDYIFYIVPEPYFEEAEDIYIQQCTKVIVNAFGEHEGWEELAGLPVEIKPLVRPYGLWTGMLFSGVVLRDGKPVPGVEIEVEYWNDGDRIKVAGEAAQMQVIRANAAGEFSFALPKAGWWGFAALGAGGELKHEGKELSLDAVIWVRCQDVK